MLLRHVTIPILLVIALAIPRPASAQSSSDFAAWVGLVTTPVGAFAPWVYVPPPATAPRRFGFQARSSHWQFAPDDDNTTNLALGAAVAVGTGRLSFEVGRTTKKDCSDCDAYMVGSELHMPLVAGNAGIGVTFNPAVGYMTTSGDSDFSAFAAAVNIPLSYSVPVGGNTRVVPFVTPGAGLGRVSATSDSETGQRFLVGGGVAFLNVSTGLQVTASASKILIEGGATVLGLAFGYGR